MHKRTRRQKHKKSRQRPWYIRAFKKFVCGLVFWSSFSGCLTGATLYCTCSVSPRTRTVRHVHIHRCIRHMLHAVSRWQCTDAKSTTSGQRQAVPASVTSSKMHISHYNCRVFLLSTSDCTEWHTIVTKTKTFIKMKAS